MSDVESPDSEPVPKIRNALETVRQRLDQIQTGDLLPMNVDPVRALTTVRGVAIRLQPLRARMLTLPDFNIEHFDNLELYARALMQANALYTCAIAPPTELAKVVSDATRLKEAFMCDVASLVKRGLLRENPFKGRQGHPSYRHLASDLLGLTIILRTHLEKAPQRSTVTIDELEQAEILVENLNALLGAKESAPEALATATLDRKKAYTLMVRSYDQVRKVVSYLKWGTSEASKLAPPLNLGRKGTRKKVPTNVEPTQESGSISPPNTAITSDVTNLIELPNMDPFVH
jgi:hypothetical protein